ncbi:MAG: hypothetical protein ACTSRG_14130 [Candidatus Helarchaeota archaeon]
MPIEIIPKSEIKLRSISEVFKDLPPEYKLKDYLPITANALIGLRIVGDFKGYAEMSEFTGEFISRFLDARNYETVEFSKAVKEGRIAKDRLGQTVTYWGIPPVMSIRGDISSFSSKMIYGPSNDITFCAISDLTKEITFLFNIHTEEGLAEDYWYIFADDDLFNRRHMRLGYRLKEIPQKINGLGPAADKIRDIMMDIRNERTPQWRDSSYHICLFYLTGAATMGLELSSYNALASIWDGVNAVNYYGMKEQLFAYEPWPPILNVMFGLERGMWTQKLTRMLTDNLLFINYMEKETIDFFKKHYYESYEYFMKLISYQIHQGIPLPIQTIECVPPKFNREKGIWETPNFQYPKENKIDLLGDLGLTFEEAIGGVLLDIDHTFRGKVTRENIISLGHGLKTKYLKPPTKKKKKLKKIKKIKKIRKKIIKNQ